VRSVTITHSLGRLEKKQPVTLDQNIGVLDMKLTHLLTFHAALAMGLGIAFTLYSPLMIALYGIPEVPGGDVLLYWNVAAFARMFGAALFGLGILLWALRKSTDTQETPLELRRGILFALVISKAIGLVVALTQQMSVWLTPAGWITAALFAALLLGYAYFLVQDPGSRRVTKPSSGN
jgi:hypothetical protein